MNSKNQASVLDLPVMKVEQHEESKLHQYVYFAEFLVNNPSHIDSLIAKDPLDALQRLMSALEGIEGGILGQQACDRGMDQYTIRSLALFSREFFNSENEQARNISKSFIAMQQAHYFDKETVKSRLNEKGDSLEP